MSGALSWTSCLPQLLELSRRKYIQAPLLITHADISPTSIPLARDLAIIPEVIPGPRKNGPSFPLLYWNTKLKHGYGPKNTNKEENYKFSASGKHGPGITSPKSSKTSPGKRIRERRERRPGKRHFGETYRTCVPARFRPGPPQRSGCGSH